MAKVIIQDLPQDMNVTDDDIAKAMGGLSPTYGQAIRAFQRLRTPEEQSEQSLALLRGIYIAGRHNIG